MAEVNNLSKAFEPGLATVLTNVASGQEALVLTQIASSLTETKGLLHVCSNPQQLDGILESIGFFAPWLEVISLPAWDCLPYDRVSPTFCSAMFRKMCLKPSKPDWHLETGWIWTG